MSSKIQCNVRQIFFHTIFLSVILCPTFRLVAVSFKFRHVMGGIIMTSIKYIEIDLVSRVSNLIHHINQDLKSQVMIFKNSCISSDVYFKSCFISFTSQDFTFFKEMKIYKLICNMIYQHILPQKHHGVSQKGVDVWWFEMCFSARKYVTN